MNEPAAPVPASVTKLTAPSTTLIPALAGALLCWLAFPPVGWSYLAWVGPVPWLLLVAQEKLPGPRPYRTLWLGGAVFWLLTVHWIRLPHPLSYLAWVALATYLGLYLPAFVALARVGVVRWRMPLVLVAPVVWTGLEWFRAHLLTGFLMGSLAHTQVHHLPVIQIAALSGEYGVTCLILLVAASIAKTLLSFCASSEPGPGAPGPRRITSALHLLPAAVALCAALLYGQTRSADIERQESRPGPKIALIQGNSLADWKSDPQRQQEIMDQYIRLSREAVRSHPDVDLVIWPETMFRETLITVEEGYHPPPDRVPPENLAAARDYLKLLTKELGTAVLAGIDRYHVFPDGEGKFDYRVYNSAVLVDAQGNILGTYDKMHRVPFGEFIPFADWLPALYKLTPIAGGIAAGTAAAGLHLGRVLYAPNICYESAVPHLVRRQVLELARQNGRVPDVLVNLTNDAWFWGSSELDMHLACDVFRAVEMRIPLVVAANGGLSAYVDSLGTVQEVSRRQTPQVLTADVKLFKRPTNVLTLYTRWGDWFALACVLCCMVLAVDGWRGRRKQSAVAPARRGTAR